MALRESSPVLRCVLVALAAFSFDTDLTPAPSPTRVRANVATTFTVNSTADTSDTTAGDGICDAGSGICTLRAAIEEANANAGNDTIAFAIGSGAQTIMPGSALPMVAEGLTIDGTTQPGYAGTPLVEIDGINAGNTSGLNIPQPNTSTIRGLLINRFQQHGIALGASNSTIESCYIGTDATKTQNRGNAMNGIQVFEGDGNLIRYNVIARNNSNGVQVVDGSNYSFPLFTALTPDQTAIFPSIDFNDNCTNFQHATAGLITDTLGRGFNENFGMRLTATMNLSATDTYTFTFTQLDDQGRLMIDGVERMNVNGPGPHSTNVSLSAGDHSFEVDYWEGGGAAQIVMTVSSGSPAPTFTFGGNPGFQGELFQGSLPATGNKISENSTFDNGEQGIALSCCCRDTNDAGDIDHGANTFLNYPVITTHFTNMNGSITIQGTAPVGSYVEVFGAAWDVVNPGNGYGEGKLHVATSAIVDGSGNFIATFNLPPAYNAVTTTATDASGNTSEFSQNRYVRLNQITVTNANDSGPGSLRDAIFQANGDGVDTNIAFDPSLSGASITLSTSLPPLTENNTIIGGDLNADCRPDIELNGGAGATTGITMQSANNKIHGLALNRFGNEAVVIEGGGATANQIYCTFLGTNLAGTAAMPNGTYGVVVRNGAGSNRIAENNVISAFDVAAVWISNGPNNAVGGSKIGTDLTGTVTMPSPIGVQVDNANGTYVGEANNGNRIVATNGAIDINGGNTHRVYANTISSATGYGIRLHSNANNAIIGGTAPGEANTIENNGGAGILVAGSVSNAIRANSISGNGSLGIDLGEDGVTPNDPADSDNGANQLLNFPVLTSATTDGLNTSVSGFLDAPSGPAYILDFFVSPQKDPTGYGEGATYLSSQNIASGSFATTLPAVPAGSFITATATDTGPGNTSEYSLAIEATGSPLGATELVAFPVMPTAIRLRWKDPQAGETGFRIERSFDGSSFGQLTNVGPDVTTHTDSAVVSQQTVWYRVIATSSSGDGPPSNVATTTAFSNQASNVCRTTMTPTMQFADVVSAAHDGTNWAVAWSDKKNGREADIFFQKLDNATGAPIGSPVLVSNDDVSSRNPTLAWNGSQFGLLWFDHLREPNGETRSSFSFALLDASGNKVRGDIKIGNANRPGSNPDGQLPLVWDGSGWGIFLLETPSGGGSQQVMFYRLAANGDVLVNGVQALMTPAAKSNVSAAWSGTEYAFVYVVNQNQLRLVRMQSNGTAIGSFIDIGSTGPGGFTAGTNVVWDGAAWAVVWADALSSGDSAVFMRRVDAAGNPLGPGPVRISDDGSVFDELPRLLNRPGGGFLVYVTSDVNGVGEIGRLEADASGNRVGARIILTANDGFNSWFPRAASNGTSTLVAWEETSANLSEVAAAVVSSGGVPGPVQNVTTGHTPPGSVFRSPVVVPQSVSGFMVAWLELNGSGPAQLNARLVRQNGTFVDRRPLNDAATNRRPAVVSHGSTFSVAWANLTTSSIRFRVYDDNGNGMNPAYDVATGADASRGVGLDYDGQLWGVVWVHNNGELRFQRTGNNTPVGVPTTVSPGANGFDPMVHWTGYGWAVVWRASGNLWFARLDPAGALVIPPTRITDFGASQAFDVLWSGSDLGVTWSQGGNLWFTIVDRNGIKKFAPVSVAPPGSASSQHSLYFDGTAFHVVYQSLTGMRDVSISTGGVVSGTSQFYANHGEGLVDAAFNGATLALAWSHNQSLLFQTTACLADASPPSCTTLNGTFASGAVQLNWPPANDPQSGILAYHLYRDGRLLTELLSSTTSYTDGGFTPAAVHNYELRPFNGAYLEATGCAPKAVTAGILVLPATLPNAKQNNNYNQTVTASQGTGPYTFAVTTGALPNGLALNPNSGAITGTPTTVSASNFTITATDSTTATGSRAYAMRVCPNTTLVPTVFPDPIVDSAYSQTMTLRGSSDSFTTAVTSGALPAGLTLTPGHVLSGTPTATGAFSFTVTATESTGCTTSQGYTFTVQSGKAPRNAFAMAQSSSSILVRWDRPLRGETGFRVERSTDSVTWGAINNVGADVTSNLDSGLIGGRLYYYRVVAFSGALDSATSNVTAAMTFPSGPTKICQQPIGPYHPRAQAMSATHDGMKWAVAWQDRKDNLLEEIYFQFLDNNTGIPTGAPVRVTTNDMTSRFPMVRWNGSQFGILYTENLRGPAGELTSKTSFALLDAGGNVLRSGVAIPTSNGASFLNSGFELPLTWDGGGWGVFTIEQESNPPADLYYRRLSPAGDVVTGPVRLTTAPGWEFDIHPFWNGTEYGLAWVEQTDATSTLKFRRMQADGTLVGSPVTLDTAAAGESVSAPNVTWNGSEWAVAWLFATTESIVRLRRLNPDGTPKGPAARISDDPSVIPNQPVDDNAPLVYPKSGGGYLIFTVSRRYTTSVYQAARLEADAAGNRAGSRVFLTPDDGLGTNVLRAATDGTRFLLAHDAIGPAQMEAVNLIVDAAGNTTNGPTSVTTGHGDGNSSPALVPVGAGFAAIWYETGPTAQLQAKMYDGGGNLTATKTPLSPSTGLRSSIGAVGAGNTFAVAWRDATSLRFCRFDDTGNPLIAEAALPSGGNQANLGWNGEHYGLAFFEGGNLRFQRINADGTLAGPKIAVADGQGNILPQLLWAGSGWALVWRSNNDYWYTLLDRNGAYVVEPIRFTFTATPKNVPVLAFSGERIGVAWSEMRGFDPPGNDLWFTALELDGTKAFAEKNLVSTPYSDGNPSIYWDQDRFRIVYVHGTSGTRELAVQPDGTVVGAERLFHNRQIGMRIAFNGVTLGMLFNGLFDLTLQTSACFDDPDGPPCPSVSTNFNGQRVRLTWPFVSDPGSGILNYNVYRDGVHIAEVAATNGLFDDKGFVSGATHVYEVRALNRAYRESTGCTTKSVVAGIAVLPATLPNGNVGGSYTQTFTGSQGTSPYTFAVSAGALPPGLTLNGTTGQLSGTPTTSGLFSFTITATDSTTATGSRAYTLRICSGITLYPTLLAEGYLNSAYSQTIVTSGAVGVVNLSITSGALPAGLTLDPTGWIHGTPTALGASNFTILATDSIGCTSSRAYSIVISSGSAVRHLAAMALGTTSIRLRWTDPQRNENGFRIERSTDLGANWSPLAIVGPDTTTYVNTGLAAGTTYSYRVIATSPGGDAAASNLATAATFPATAAKSCVQQVNPYHSAARSPSVTSTGTQWAMAYQDRKGNEDEEIYFTFLTTSGAMAGTPVRLTVNDPNSFRPTIRWNGSKFGVMWIEQIKGAAGEAMNPYRFALLDAGGNVLRTDVRITGPNEFSSSSVDAQFFWDGSAWGFFDARVIGSDWFDLYFHRFDEDGDMIGSPIRLTTHPDGDNGVIVAWNGTEYGLVWLRFNGTTTTVLFQRVSAAGALLGSPATIATLPNGVVAGIDVTAAPSGWAVVWGESGETEDVVYLRRLDATGALIGGATRLSDDFDLNGFTLADQRPTSDIFPDVLPLPGGGYGVFTRTFLNLTQRNEVGFLRADASGNRVGPRTIVSAQDSFNSGNAKVASDGTNFLAVFNESRLGTQEIASVVVSATGTIVSGPTDLTSGHSPGTGLGFVTSGQPAVASVGTGFAALWSEPISATDNRLYARIFNGAGVNTATLTPLSTRNLRGRPAAVGVGSTFATALKDATNNIVFGRWDATGTALISEVNVATSQGGSANVSLGFDGETYGVLWNSAGRLQFQRVTAAGANLGPRSTLATPAFQNPIQQMVWTGSGWAIVFVNGNDVYYALLDISGAVTVAPIRVTFTPDEGKEGLAIAWNGDALGIAFSIRPPVDPPGLVIGFTAVSPEGIKLFNEITFSEGRLDNTLQGLSWDVDHFRIAFVAGESGTLREQDVFPNGALLGASRILANRGGNASVLWNGATLGVLWQQFGELFFETSACLADVTAPPCPTVSASRSSGPVTVTWTPPADAESGIYRYEIFRDGLMIAEANGTSTSFFDAGVRGSDNHTYSVRAVNGAFRESSGCPSVVPVAIPGSVVATATSATQVTVTWSAAVGADSYTVERTSDGTNWTTAGTTAATNYVGAASAGTAYLYRVRAVQGVSTSPPSNVDLATTVLFTNDPLVANVTQIKAVHLIEMRTAVNAVRALASLGAASWTNPSPAGVSSKAVHLNELRTALSQARAALGLPPLTFTDTLTPGVTIRAIHSQEVRNGVK